MMTQTVLSRLNLKVPPLLLTLVVAGAMWVTAHWLPGLQVSTTFRYGAALVVFVVGLAFVLAGLHAFRKARTTVNPVRPEAASELVVTGIYRFTRNPMYVGFLAWLLAWGLLLASGYAFVWPVLWVVYMNWFQIGPEEQALARCFAAGWDAYRARVRRWL